MTESDKNEGQNLTERQLKAIPHLVASSTYEKGCRKARISRNTFYEWMKNPVFKAELRRQRDTIIEEALDILKCNMTNAVRILVELLDTTKNEYLKRNVAKDIIGYVIKAKELEDLDRRITEIEKLITG